ncbi:pyridoxamine 5'-phosphate oxidase family protein [Streptomyces sp. NPDC085524]|uniref:pyridoxamine 5'-phosphate oxidase family protein n=1 Tax=unclassified Streptomyces TaxID=2593676 RepID=UPI0035D7ACC5
MTVPAERHLIEVSGTEALWLLEGSGQGRLVYIQREIAMVRPATHVMEYGRLIVRVPVQSAAVLGRSLLTYQVDEINSATGTGWMVTAHGPADVIGNPVEAAHHRRTLTGWTHGPHDTLLRLHPQQVSGFRLARTVTGAGR